MPYFSCRGYTSASEMWLAAQRLTMQEDAGKQTTVFHLGDHDPSGIDMTRDIQERLELFGAGTLVSRIALTMDQVRQYDPPPNPAKMSDARYTSYAEKWGEECWELDALDPAVLADLVRDHVMDIVDQGRWSAVEEREDTDKGRLQGIALKMV